MYKCDASCRFDLEIPLRLLPDASGRAGLEMRQEDEGGEVHAAAFIKPSCGPVFAFRTNVEVYIKLFSFGENN
jgi:hypothetical protein